jgi:uncharacterized protein (DUF2132 family)
MDTPQPNNPLHGMTLKKIMQDLVEKYGWEYLAQKVQIRCFMFDPTINSSLKFLRQTPWAREKVEKIWINTIFGEKK